MKYISSLINPVTFDEMKDLYCEVKGLYHQENYLPNHPIYELHNFVAHTLMNQSSISEDDIKRFDELRAKAHAYFETEDRKSKVQYIANLIGNAEDFYCDDDKSRRYFLDAHGCYSERAILKHYGTSVGELRSALKELGLSKDDYYITYDDEVCHITLPNTLLEEVFKLEEL